MVRIVGSRQLRKRRRYQLQTTVHDGALAVSGEVLAISTSLEVMTKVLESALTDLNNGITVNNGLVGHIKGYVQLSGQALMISTTGDGVNYQILENRDADVAKNVISLTAIVFGIDQLELEEQLLTVLENVEKRGEHEGKE